MAGNRRNKRGIPTEEAERNFLALRAAGFEWDPKKRVFYREESQIPSQIVLGLRHRAFIMMMREDMLIELTPFRR